MVIIGASAVLVLVLAVIVDLGDRVVMGDLIYLCNRNLVYIFDGVFVGLFVDVVMVY